jgi:uncharacterized protein (TIGR00255 family)
MIRGMTGFGRAQGQAAWGAWAWEARSVNGKSIDARVALPQGFDVLELEAKKRVKDRFQRGNLQLQLRIDMVRAAAESAIDQDELARIVALAREWSMQGVAPPTFDGLLAIPGVMKTASRTTGVDDAMAAELLAGLDQALAALDEARKSEGQSLLALFTVMLDEVEALVKKAGELAAGQPELVRERLKARLAEVAKDVAIDQDRVAQEVILMATRADVREELDRLTAHVATARDILKSGEAAGRKLDFLCQELNRETNTLCSKSASLELTNAGLALKSLIDQFREQVQNVE